MQRFIHLGINAFLLGKNIISVSLTIHFVFIDTTTLAGMQFIYFF